MDMKSVVRFSWSCYWGLCLTEIMTQCHRFTSRLDVRLTDSFWRWRRCFLSKRGATLIHFLANVATHSTAAQPLIIPVATLFFQSKYQCWVIWPPHALCHDARGPRDANERILALRIRRLWRELDDELHKDTVENVEYVSGRHERFKL